MLGKLPAAMPSRLFNHLTDEFRRGMNSGLIILQPRNGQQILHQILQPHGILIYIGIKIFPRRIIQPVPIGQQKTRRT